MFPKPTKSIFVRFALLIVTWLLLACNFIPGVAEIFRPDPTPIPEPTATLPGILDETPTPTSEPTKVIPDDGLDVGTLDDVHLAVIRIVAKGSYVEPEETTINGQFSGTGFIINSDGIAVTNSHVVNGSGSIEVYVGDEDRPRAAKILGLSECSDLAVIQITEGSDFRYLKWYEDDIKVNLEVRAAGYPGGVEEFTLTRGIISQLNANGESSWASVRNVVMHDATINPGNSGGPLVAVNGQVIGINYAGNSSTNQYYAITRDEVQGLIEELSAENDVTSIGVNGVAIAEYGIWVSAVATGSPAFEAGIKPGDIIYLLENVFLGEDGTKSDYCRILRSHDTTERMKVVVRRYASDQFLAGELNGDPLQLVPIPSNIVGGNIGGGAGGNGSTPPTQYEYTSVTDESGKLQVKIPTTWSDVYGSIPDTDSPFDAVLLASPDLQDYADSWSVPGLFFGATTKIEMEVDEALDVQDYSEDCSYEERKPYEDELYEGEMDIWVECGGSETILAVVAAEPKDEKDEFLVVLQVRIVSEADIDALAQIWRSFVVDPDLASLAGTVTQNNVNLRTGPGQNYPRQDRLNQGDAVTVLQRTEAADWVEVEPAQKKTGWVASRFIRLTNGAIEDLPVATNLVTPPAPVPSPGPTPIQLWGNSFSGWLNPGQETWYTFNTDQNNEATLIAFVKNTDQFEMQIYHSNNIPAWPPSYPLPANTGVGTKKGNRDGDDQTVEFEWTSGVQHNEKYYVRLVNSGGTGASYCVATQPDKSSCP
ncbi:MAG: trypsin-like peptidase domain-containing protein [Anaerolineae bacterium]|nr:trypsin-like peptidase domain-containing protein [Anaerolineae bacterium]